ncbi:MAG TPA: polyphosphate kinase 1 [Lacibacter sp.]|nr:polyphosphate kinase 1 [Lacibacter sp.]HMO89804.1 polyphosphate kinase 1 [Lacibacter sp.]
MAKPVPKTNVRDISWLSFNARVLQEANDPTVPLRERLRFLGIFSNNLDEFFRVRVATLRRMAELGSKLQHKMHLEKNPAQILEQIQQTVLQQQNEFNRIWAHVQQDLKKERIHLVTEKRLNREQKRFVENYFEEEIRSAVIPLMIESNPNMPYLRERSLYLAVSMSSSKNAYHRKYALIEVPAHNKRRFIKLPAPAGQHHIILMEDILRHCLPRIFSFMGYDTFSAHIIKVTKDAEIDLDSDISSTLIQKIESGLKNRRKGRPVRFIYDKEIDAGLLEYLIRRLNISRRDYITPGGRIHNFRHFMDFPPDVFSTKTIRKKPFPHPLLQQPVRVSEIVQQRDVLLHFPYHSYEAVIELLREAAMDTDVVEIKITAYRLAESSKVINALVNAARNGKKVTVMLELRARFDEEANLEWKERLELEGVRVMVGVPNMKVHAKLCLIRKRSKGKTVQYGFVSTGNLNESTARVYGDHCLLTANRNIMADINRMFRYLEKPLVSRMKFLRQCKTLLVSPTAMRARFTELINNEIRNAHKGLPAAVTIKMNSLSDDAMITKLYEAAQAGVRLRLIIRGIFCMRPGNKKFKEQPYAISIVDQYLEHSRVLVFHNRGNEKVFLSSADWMVRNLDHRIEAAAEITHAESRQELLDYVSIQLKDNNKARILDNELENRYVPRKGKLLRSQVELYQYLYQKTVNHIETGSH